MDLKGLIAKDQCKCLGGTDDYSDVFTDGGNSLKSNFDEELILSVNFNQSVKIHAIKLKAPEKFGPKTLKLFINENGTMDFERAKSCSAIQEIMYVCSSKNLCLALSIHQIFSKFSFFHLVTASIQRTWQETLSIYNR